MVFWQLFIVCGLTEMILKLGTWALLLLCFSHRCGQYAKV